MSKAEQIMKMVREGKTFQEIVDSGQKEKYVQITLGKNGYDWKTMEPKISEESKFDVGEPKEFPKDAPEIVPEKPLDSIDHQMKQMEDNQQVTQMAQAMKLVMENPQAFLLAMGNIESESKGVIKRVEKCHRHPHIDVKPGENCPECLAQSHQHEQMKLTREYVLPCPKCGNNKKQSMGGYIKTLIGKPGHYSCGNCRISYNTAGESCEWGPKDQAFFDKAMKKGLV